MADREENIKTLEKLGVSDPIHQKVLLESIPCGMESVQKVVDDETNVMINAPRAIAIIGWKDSLRTLARVESEREKVEATA